MKRNKTNKKGDIVLPEVLKLVIAVLCILLLLYLAYSLYGIFIGKNEQEKAKATLNEIELKIKSLEEGEERKVIVTGPEGWYLVSYGNGVLNLKNCQKNNCLCMCKTPWGRELEEEMKKTGNEWSADTYLGYFKTKDGIEQCEKINICIEARDIELQYLVRYELGLKNIEEQVNWLPLYNLPENIYLKKENNRILLKEKAEEEPGKVLDKFFEIQIFTGNIQEESVEQYLRSYANCEYKSNKIDLYQIDHAVDELGFIIPGKERQDIKANREIIVRLLLQEYYKEIQESYKDGYITFNFVDKDGSITSRHGKDWGCCASSSCKCDKIEEEKLICDKDFKIYLRFYVP